MVLWLACVMLMVLRCASNAVVELTAANFLSFVNGSNHLMVEFYAPWCGHCKKFAPEYERVARSVNVASNPRVIVARVDVMLEKNLGDRFGIYGFPQLKWLEMGATARADSIAEHAASAIDYTGAQTAHSIVEWVSFQAALQPAIRLIPLPGEVAIVGLNRENFDAIALDPNTNTLVYFYAPWSTECREVTPIIGAVAKVFQAEAAVTVAKVDIDEEPDLAEKHSVSGIPTVKIFASGDDKEAWLFDEKISAAALVEFLNDVAETQRAADGSLALLAGRLEDFDVIASQFRALLPGVGSGIGVQAGVEEAAATGGAGADASDTSDALPTDERRVLMSRLVAQADAALAAIASHAGPQQDTPQRSSEESCEAAEPIQRQQSPRRQLSTQRQRRGAYYLRLMRRARDRGPASLEAERKRVDRMLAGGGLHAEARDRFMERRNILRVFADAGAGASNAVMPLGSSSRGSSMQGQGQEGQTQSDPESRRSEL